MRTVPLGNESGPAGTHFNTFRMLGYPQEGLAVILQKHGWNLATLKRVLNSVGNKDSAIESQ